MVASTVPRFSWFPALALPLAAALLLSAGCQSILGLDKYSPSSDDSEVPGKSGGSGNGGEGGEPSDGECVRASDCDDDNECTEDLCKSQKCDHDPVAGGTACDGGVCTGVSGAEKCQACIDNEADSEIDAGCSQEAPQCRTTGTVRCVGCEKHADCDDDNECTLDACQTNGSCKYTAKAAGQKCKQGVCSGEATEEACVLCIDSEDGLEIDKGCDEDAPICSGSACLKCQDSGDEVDLGCTEGTPSCDETSGLCFNECSSVECDNGGCEVVPDDTRCPTTDGCQGRCDKLMGCVQRIPTVKDDLIVDKSFEASVDDSYWGASESVDNADYVALDLSEIIVTSGDAFEGTHVARMPSGAGLDYDLYQTFDMPPRAIKLTFSGYYRAIVLEGTPNPSEEAPGDYMFGSLYNYDTESFDPDFVTTVPGLPYSVDDPLPTTWTRFEYDVTDFSNLPADGQPELNYVSKADSDAPTVIYELDSVDVIATVCE